MAILSKREARFRLEAHTMLGCIGEALDRIYGPDCTEKELTESEVLKIIETIIPYTDARRHFLRGLFNDSLQMPELEIYVSQCRMEARRLKTELETMSNELFGNPNVKITFDRLRDSTKGCSENCKAWNKDAEGWCPAHQAEGQDPSGCP